MITIIIPSYNQAEYLPDAIESALAQTKDCEVIVVDDGSTDNSLKIAKKYPVKVVSQVNKGLASARNTGIMNATGDYILPLDADDVLLENCVEQMEKAIETSKADVVACSFKTFGINNGEVLLSGMPTLEDFKTGNRIGYFSAIKRDVLLEIGGYNPRMTYGWEDWDIWFDIFKRGKTLCIIPEILILYRTKENSMIHTADAHGNELYAQMVKNHPQVWQS